MLPSKIVAWADKYELDQTIVWEIIETVTDGEDLDSIQDESHLFDLTVEWAVAMTQGTYEDPTRRNTQSFLMYYLPIVYHLAPYLTIDQRSELINAAGHDTPVMTDAMYIVLDRPTTPNL